MNMWCFQNNLLNNVKIYKKVLLKKKIVVSILSVVGDNTLSLTCPPARRCKSITAK
jgi:hypothetical protein